ncbi:MAG: KamA family radical SAM protein [Desulfatitalea sp.]|nr:KamA family radical SAM protein [Desulfatitalea sp.]NNK00240.1 KamA family radical SAM protein [Desulfatitalea sp.]
MKRQQIEKRLDAILDMAPELKAVLFSGALLDEKKRGIRNWLFNQLNDTYEQHPNTPPLEYLQRRDAIDVFRKIMSTRNEHLAGYSWIGYINDLLTGGPTNVADKPTPAFFAELEHLIKGIVGKTGIYSKKIPAFTKHQGTKAARLRSADLSRMARVAQRYLHKYHCGLDNEAIRRRGRNKQRILKHFDVTELAWGKWRWHLRHIIRDADQLKSLVPISDTEYEAVRLARKNRIPFGITPFYLSLFDDQTGGRRDLAIRAQVIPSLHYVRSLMALKARNDCSMDFMLERDTSPTEGITRRYPNIVILKPILTCPQICVYCQRNWEIEDAYSPHSVLSKEKLDRAIQWIADTPEINEVLVTGGDPLLMTNKQLEIIVSRLAAIPHIIRIRIGTRTPVTLPQRINESLVHSISRFHIPGKREIVLVTHFEHPYEITPEAMEAVQWFRRYGIEVYNQMVFTYYNSRKFEACQLRQKLRLIGVTPYYTFNTKGKEETNDFRVPMPRLIQEQKEEARLLPGTVRTDEIVFNVPGLGKNYIKASQHHDIISILPDGRRVYEFHPWEKKLSLADTYIYHDVPIYDYLKRLKSDGEDVADYKSIWYYY